MTDAGDGRRLLATACTKRIGVASHATRCIHLTRHSAHADCAGHGVLHTESAFSSSTCLHVMSVDKRFIFVPSRCRMTWVSSAVMSSDDRLPRGDKVIIDDGSSMSRDRASVVEELVELQALVRVVHEVEVL